MASTPCNSDLVVKIGGAAGVQADAVMDSLARHAPSRRTVVVHGGSGETDALAARLGRPAQTLLSPQGQPSRCTHREDLEIFAMATALVNRRLVEGLTARGLPAFGCSGLDGGLVTGPRKDCVRVRTERGMRIVRDQWTGRPTEVDGGLFRTLLDAGRLPVVAPLIGSPAGEMLNCDGDRLAAAITGTLRADTLVILSNVPGLLADPADPHSLIREITLANWDQAEASAQGRMRKKLMGAREALTAGVSRVILADSRVEDPIGTALGGGGTWIHAA